MDKRGQGISIQTIVLVVLSLIAIVIIIMVLRQQVTEGAGKYGEFGKEAELESDKCVNFILGRGCFDSVARCQEQNKRQVFPNTGAGWSDCAPPQVCCQ